ncbi:MAG: DUF2232 domain-containing protein, partial [candidate division Zixibacteria bacterium]|nr:DUF2232 domain-containing protein [candidate division Zixibacteria bacterium]
FKEMAELSVKDPQLLSTSMSVIRLVPMAEVMNPVLQFTIGFMWFLAGSSSSLTVCGSLRPFSRWKMPFAFIPVVIVVAVVRLTTLDPWALAADNVLATLSVFYCATGLSLVDHVLSRMKVGLGVKIAFYVLLTISGVLGYLMTALLGFIDSFADWRKVSEDPASLEITK